MLLAARRTGFFSVSSAPRRVSGSLRKGIEKLTRDFFAEVLGTDVTVSLGGALAYPSYEAHALRDEGRAAIFGLPPTRRAPTSSPIVRARACDARRARDRPASVGEETIHQMTTTVAGRRRACSGAEASALARSRRMGGASMHWSRHGEPRGALRGHRPDLPGSGARTQKALGSVGAYARWLAELMDALTCRTRGVSATRSEPRSCRLATDYPERCRGSSSERFPMPVTPPVMSVSVDARSGTASCERWRRGSLQPATLKRAFTDRRGCRTR